MLLAFSFQLGERRQAVLDPDIKRQIAVAPSDSLVECRHLRLLRLDALRNPPPQLLATNSELQPSNHAASLSRPRRCRPGSCAHRASTSPEFLTTTMASSTRRINR